MTTTEPGSLGTQVRRGVLWSTLNNLTLRAGTLAVGIALARLLVPEQFGVYAIALTVQSVLMTLADLGLSADLVRSDDPDRRAPTVGSLGLVAGLLMAGTMVLSAGGLADLLGSPDSAPVIAALAGTVALAGAGVVPYAMLQRRFEQRKLFVIAFTDFVISTVVTLALVLAGWGVMSLAVGRLAAQTSTLVLQFRLSGCRPQYGFDPTLSASVLRFGLPVAGANMVSWTLINLDNVVISRVAGPVALGFYVLAFNISNWPMSAIGQVVRSVALPAFARIGDSHEEDPLAHGVGLTWALALPAGAALAVLAGPVVGFVYGEKWAPSAGVLAALGLFGSVRVVFDLMTAYLLARGASGWTLAIQVLWFVTLVPAMIIGTRVGGIVGGGWAHLAVAVLVILPVTLVAVQRQGADLRSLARLSWPPLLATVPAALIGYAATLLLSSDVLALAVGAAGGAACYALLVGAWFRRLVATTRPPAQTEVVLDHG